MHTGRMRCHGEVAKGLGGQSPDCINVTSPCTVTAAVYQKRPRVLTTQRLEVGTRHEYEQKDTA